MTTANQVNGKDLITNDSINPSLSLEELLQFDVDSKRHAIHSLQVHGQYQYNPFEIDRDLFEPMPEIYTYDQIKSLCDETAIDEALSTVFKVLKDHEQQMIMKTDTCHFELGKQIYQATEQLKFNGDLQLSKGQLLGFIAARGNGNGFDVDKVSHAINFLHHNAPRRNFGVNNCNTGQLMHKWHIDSDYIYLRFEYSYEHEVKVLQEWFETIKHVQELSDADLFRLQVDDVGHGGYYVTLVMLWD